MLGGSVILMASTAVAAGVGTFDAARTGGNLIAPISIAAPAIICAAVLTVRDARRNR